jgi:hypothetical protein
MKSIFPDIQISVLQDIYHAQMRVIKLLFKQHTDYWSAVNDLKTIMHKLHYPSSYLTVQHFIDSLQVNINICDLTNRIGQQNTP